MRFWPFHLKTYWCSIKTDLCLLWIQLSYHLSDPSQIKEWYEWNFNHLIQKPISIYQYIEIYYVSTCHSFISLVCNCAQLKLFFKIWVSHVNANTTTMSCLQFGWFVWILHMNIHALKINIVLSHPFQYLL